MNSFVLSPPAMNFLIAESEKRRGLGEFRLSGLIDVE